MAAEDNIASLQESINGVVEGAQLSERFQVSNPKSKTCFSVTPVLVDFSRVLLQRKPGIEGLDDSSSVISGISNSDLLHSVIGLYDICLSELTPDVLYATVCGKWARTIVLVRDVKDAFLEFEKRRDRKDKAATASIVIPDKCEGNDVYVCPEPESSTFSCCYSDSSDSEEDDDSDDDEEEDYSKGINRYICDAVRRRESREKHSGPFTLAHVGPENRIVAACTFDKKYIKTGEKIVHLTLLSIRKRFRRLGLGKYLVLQVKDSTVSGAHDAVVVHAESEAVSFFTRCGFTDDLILNSKWREIAEQFTNCNLLTYIPAYTGQSLSNTVTDFDLLALDHELRKWRDKSLEAHQSQVTIIERMKAEMIRLRSMVTTQERIIAGLKSKVVDMEANQRQTENELLLNKVQRMSLSRGSAGGEDTTDGMASPNSLQQRYQLVSSVLPDVDSSDSVSPSTVMSAPPSSSLLAADTEQELKRYVVVANNSGEVYDHGKDIAQFHRICEDFKNSLQRDASAHREYNVTSVSKALLSSAAISRYASMMRTIGDSGLVMKLYYCGACQHPERLEQILKDGFSEQDVSDGDYGLGVYFSRSASTAVHFSPSHKVLVAEVIIGKCQTLVSKDKGRRSADKGYNSILCPGRLSTVSSDSSLVQEYVIFDLAQALPLDLIEYSTHTVGSEGDQSAADIDAGS